MLGNNELKLQGIGQILVLEKLLIKAEATTFYQNAVAERISLPQYLIRHNILSALDIAHATARSFGIPIIDIDCIDINTLPITLVSEQLILSHFMVPLFHRGTDLYLATDDPSNQSALKEIQFHTGLNTQAIVVETHKLSAFIDYLSSIKEHQELSEYRADTHFSEREKYLITTDYADNDDTPIIKFINKILLKAIEQGVSDVHFEPFEKEYRIRYRHDGVLHEISNPPTYLSARITARIKVMSHLDISERRIPQDGSFKMNLSNNRSIEFRVNTCPTTNGEKIAIRILDPGTIKLGIDTLGFTPIQQEHFLQAIKRPQGMILVTGPTGSGKTVSLYTALNLLNTKEVNISTIEDPVEIKVDGINQVNINPKVGLTFSSALRSFLRQDPDIIMVGEIRDLETAEIAVKAAQTGHLVLSTLHTNSAVETLTRLINMGIPTINIASSVTLIMAQRLVRKLCDHCKQRHNDFTQLNLLRFGFHQTDLDKIQLYRAVGCPKCTHGYQGRIGLFEVLPINKILAEFIMSGANTLEIEKIAQKQGMITIYQSGIKKVREGITTLEELNRVTIA